MNSCLNQLDLNRNLAVAISREHVLNSDLKHRAFCFERSNEIYSYALKFLMQKEFPYRNELNEFIRMASARGLIENWRTHKKIQYRNNYNQVTANFINQANLDSCRMIYCGIIVFVFLVLFSERLIYKKVRHPHPCRFWLIAQMIIDPHRNFWLETQQLNGNFAF